MIDITMISLTDYDMTVVQELWMIMMTMVCSYAWYIASYTIIAIY